MAAPLFVEIFPHVVLPAEVPAAWEMIEFLELIHILQGFEMSAADIEVDDPIVAFLALLDTVEFEGVDDTFVLRACDFVVELCLFEAVDPFRFIILYSAAFGVFEEDGGGAILEHTSHEMDLVALFVACFFAVEVDAFVEGFVIHPDAVEGLFAVGLAEARFYIHAFAFDQLDFRIHLKDLLFGHDLFFLLDDG